MWYLCHFECKLRFLNDQAVPIVVGHVCRVTDAGVKDLISDSPGLHKISLYWNVHITDAVLLKLSNSCPKLTHLNLSGCKRITDKGLMAIARKCPELVDVDLTRHAFSMRHIWLEPGIPLSSWNVLHARVLSSPVSCTMYSFNTMAMPLL